MHKLVDKLNYQWLKQHKGRHPERNFLNKNKVMKKNKTCQIFIWRMNWVDQEECVTDVMQWISQLWAENNGTKMPCVSPGWSASVQRSEQEGQGHPMQNSSCFFFYLSWFSSVPMALHNHSKYSLKSNWLCWLILRLFPQNAPQRMLTRSAASQTKATEDRKASFSSQSLNATSRKPILMAFEPEPDPALYARCYPLL